MGKEAIVKRKETEIEQKSLPDFQNPKSLTQACSMIFELGCNLSEHAYIIGKILIWVKKEVGHGNFENWIEDNVWFIARTVRNFIKFAHKCRRNGYLMLYFPSKRQSLPLLAFEPKIYDIWNFQGIDDRFGQSHPGNIPAGIVLNALYYYTDEDDLVVDPMAGGGLTIDCCKYLKRRCLSYDINPKRSDIKKLDVTKGYPEKAHNCDFIFIDPPYYKKLEEEYGEDSISALPKNEYMDSFRVIAKNSLKCLKESAFLAFLMEPYIDYENSNESIWLYDYVNIFLSENWTMERIIDVPESSQRYAAHDVIRTKENKQMLTLRRQLIIFRK